MSTNSVTNQNISDPNKEFLAFLDSLAPKTFQERTGAMLLRGIPIIPLLPRSKAPCTEHAVKDATTDPAIIADWVKRFDPDSNCGARADYYGCWFADDDSGTFAEKYKADTGQELPKTLTVRTSRGFHYYFLHDDASRTVRYGGHENSGVIDIPGYKGEARCNNQYVVAPGSIHPSGVRYEIHDDAPLVAAPVQLLEWVQSAYALSESLKPESRKPNDNAKTDSGFRKLFDAVGYQPLIKRINALDDARVHVSEFRSGDTVPCPMPHHKHNDYTPCFGSMKDEPGLLHCLGNCKWTGDMVAAVYKLDGGANFRNMYDAARAICTEENLNFEEFFPANSVAVHEVNELPEQSPTESVAEPIGKYAPATKDVAPQDARGKDSDMSSECFSDLKPKPIVWLWKERIPKDALIVFSGNPDCGKTTVSIDIIARYTKRLDWPDGAINTEEPGCVLVLTEEDDCENTYLPRLMAAGADTSRVHHITGVPVGKDATTEKRVVALDTDLSRLKRKIENMRGAGLNLGLVVVDPITNYMGRADMNKEQEVRRVLGPIANLCRECQVTFIAVGHFNKRLDVAALHRVGGAVGMTGVSRAAWLFAKSPDADGEYQMMLGKGNLTKKRTGLKYRIGEKDLGGGITAPFIVWGEETTTDADSVLATAANPEEKKSAKAIRFLTDHFANLNGPQRSDCIIEAAKRAGIAGTTLFNARKTLRILTEKTPGGWTWTWQHRNQDSKTLEDSSVAA